MLLRSLSWLALAAAAMSLPATAIAGQATTTRIETRPFYGATVTVEAGVRVFRPLPPHGNVIINPGGRTPLSLNIEQRLPYGHGYGGYGYGGYGSTPPASNGYADDRYGYGAYGAPVYGGYRQGHGAGHPQRYGAFGQGFGPHGFGPRHHRSGPPSIRPHIATHPVKVHAPPMYRGGGGGGKR